MKSLKLQQQQQRLLYYQKKKNPSKNLRQKEPTMSPSFVFDPPSDEEIEHSEHEEEEEEESVGEPESGSESESEGEGGEVEEGHKEARVPKKKKKKTQSPWDFAKYTESVAEEHARRSTTSVDEKISKALKQRSTPLVAELDHSSESEPDEQVIIGFSFCFFVHSYTLLGFYSYTIDFFFICWDCWGAL